MRSSKRSAPSVRQASRTCTPVGLPRPTFNACACTDAAYVKAWRKKTGGKSANTKPASKKEAKQLLAKTQAAAAIDALPKGSGATAKGRAAAFKSGKRTEYSAEQAYRRTVRASVESVSTLAGKGKHAQAAAVVGGFCRHPAVAPYLPAADVSTSGSLAETMVDNIGNLIKLQTESSGRGRRTYQAEAGTQAIFTAVTSEASPKKNAKATAARWKKPPPPAGPTPVNGSGPTYQTPTQTPTQTGQLPLPVRAASKLLKVPVSTGSRLFKVARKARRALTAHEANAYWVDMGKRIHRLGRSKVTPEKLEKLVEWLNTNEYIRV